ncbi:hypothetical protein PRIPAC_96084, partial [Pristionchus pacificus]|uniref:G protein-coupled receptor n=1 Tax=Pristionchus pacificus TaxID=54126 RepID=A0A2A6D308_PRIPA
ISFHAFAMLGVASTLSETAKRNNKFLTNVLIIQASFPVFLIGLPLIFSLIAAVSSLELQSHYLTKTLRHGCTALSIMLSTPALSVVVLCAQQTSTKYAVLIATIVILGVFNDIVLNLVWDPLMLLPDLCIMRENPSLNIPGGPNYYYEFWAFLISMNVPVIGACFLERHQVNIFSAVQRVQSRFLLPVYLRNIIIGLFALGSFLISTSLSASWHTFASLKIASTLSESVKRNNASLSKTHYFFLQIVQKIMFFMFAVLDGLFVHFGAFPNTLAHSANDHAYVSQEVCRSVCGLALFIVSKSQHLRTSTFGEICRVQMISDISLILLNTTWCLINAYAQSVVHYRYALLIGVISKTLYFFTCKLHVLMAVNRYIFIFHATENKTNTSVFKGSIFLCFVMAFLQSLSGPLLDSNLFVVFSSDTLRWQFATTEWTPFYEAYLEYYVVLTECSVIIVLDCASFVKLRHIHRIISKNKAASAREMRLLLQSFCQLIPLSSVMVFFFFVAPECKSAFIAFLSSTAALHFGISLDG